MKPNQLGGHTVEPDELGVVRNALTHVNDALGVIELDDTPPDQSTLYLGLARIMSVNTSYPAFQESVDTLVDTSSDPSYKWELGIEETRVVMVCLKWLADPNSRSQMLPFYSSAAQIDQARAIVAKFNGEPLQGQ